MNSEVVQIAEAAVRRYAESHPRPIQVTITQAQEMLGRSQVTISKMIKAGSIRRNALGLIPISEIDRVLSVRSAA